MYRIHYTFVIYHKKKEEVTYSERSYYDVSSDETPSGQSCRKEIIGLAQKHCTNRNLVIRHANYFKIEKL